ncbi:oligosaccharide flippase family protein [bacterium]|nr:oligosaccharide flippase family protein [bacterium]
MSGLKKLASDTAIYGVSSVLGRILNLVLTPIYTKKFLPGAYGVFVDLYAFIAMINVALIFGMETTFFRHVQDEKKVGEVYAQAFIWVTSLATLFLILGLLLHQPIANLLGYPENANWIIFTVIVIFLDVCAALPMAKLRHEGKAVRFATINLINIALTIALNLILIFGLGAKLDYIFIANMAASSLRMVMAFYGNIPDTFKPDKTLMKELVNYGFYIMIAGLAGILAQMLDRVLIPRIWVDGTLWEGIARTGEEMNGLYGANYKVAMLIGLATQAFRYAVEPFFFKKAKDKDSPETFARVFHYYILAALVGFLVLASFARELVSIEVFGYSFLDEKYWPALTIVPILLMAYVMNGAYVNLSIWFKITKQVRFAILFTGVGVLITILINLLTIRHFGYMGSAWSALICFTTMTVMVYLLGQKYYPIPYRISRLLAYLLVFVGAYLINRQIGDVNGLFFVFFWKTSVVLFAIAVVAFSEKYFPVFGEAPSS